MQSKASKKEGRSRRGIRRKGKRKKWKSQRCYKNSVTATRWILEIRTSTSSSRVRLQPSPIAAWELSMRAQSFLQLSMGTTCSGRASWSLEIWYSHRPTTFTQRQRNILIKIWCSTQAYRAHSQTQLVIRWLTTDFLMNTLSRITNHPILTMRFLNLKGKYQWTGSSSLGSNISKEAKKSA